MKYKKNYKILHVSELEEELRNLDGQNNPEEMEYIQKLIAQGGYQYPSKTIIESVEINNAIYKWGLLIFIALLMVINIFSLLVYSQALALIPVAFQSIIVYMIFTKNEYLKVMIIVWSVLLIIAGGFGLLATMTSSTAIQITTIADQLLFLVAGVLLVAFSGKCITVNEKLSARKI